MTRNTFRELHNCGHKATYNTELPDFYTLVLNNCQQFTIAEREKYRCESSFQVQSFQNMHESSRCFSAKLDINFLCHKSKQFGKYQFVYHKNLCCNKIPFMPLKCICHSFLVAVKKTEIMSKNLAAGEVRVRCFLWIIL